MNLHPPPCEDVSEEKTQMKDSIDKSDVEKEPHRIK